MAEKPTIVFMGTAPFAAVILQGLHEGGYRPLAVYTQPDRPAGRGMSPRASAVKELAETLGLAVRQPENFRAEMDRQALAALKPDFLVVAAYGLILPQAVLDIPRVAPINVHGSLLPGYRGAAPIQRAIMENWQSDAETGVSIMRMVRAMDAGPVYATAAVPLAAQTTETLTPLLAEAGARLLLQVLPQIAAGSLSPCEQDESLVTYAAKLTKEDGVIDWSKPVAAVDAQIRGVTPWPGAQAMLKLGDRELPLTIMRGEAGEKITAEPGIVTFDKDGLTVACCDGLYRVLQVKPKGRKIMAARDFANGLRMTAGVVGRMA